MVRPLLAIALILAALTAFFYLRKPNVLVLKPLTWEECLKTPGAMIMTIYPGRCSTPDGRKATQPISKEDQQKLQPSYGNSTKGKCLTNSDCRIGGCSKEICQSKFEEPIYSACVMPSAGYPEDLGYNCFCKNFECQWIKN